MRTSLSLYHRHRFPAEIISHCVWLYFRFALSFRDVEEMLAMRGVVWPLATRQNSVRLFEILAGKLFGGKCLFASTLLVHGSRMPVLTL